VIASRDNPLTARVIVNRVWMYHFGKPLVSTPSDFGVRGDPPVEPELLDYLSATLMENGWSLKKLHRQIMLSNVYKQSCDAAPLAAKRDPENKLLGRMNRQRMEFEPLRDTLLALSGTLDPNIGGRPLPALFTGNNRRSIYTFVDRQDLPGVLRTFDFADPGAHSPQRSVTTVPQQALFLMNNPFVLDQVKALLARPEINGKSDPKARLAGLFREVYGRAPTSPEIAGSLSFINGWKSQAAVDNTPVSPWHYGYGEYDPANQKVNGFTLLPHFTGSSWQGGDKVPDPKIGWVLLRAEGGHPGDPQHCAIRRWVAPYAMTLNIQGRLDHPAKVGDGVEAIIVSSKSGKLGSWVAKGSSIDVGLDHVQVARGEIIDFVLSCRADNNSDSFGWAPTLEAVNASTAPQAVETHWDAAADFAGPAPAHVARQPLTGWEVYTQALLLTNEFLFID